MVVVAHILKIVKIQFYGGGENPRIDSFATGEQRQSKDYR